MRRVPWGSERFWSSNGPRPSKGERCPDCSVRVGKLHNSSVKMLCDVEECPRCHRQLISCGHAPEFIEGYGKPNEVNWAGRLLKVMRGGRRKRR